MSTNRRHLRYRATASALLAAAVVATVVGAWMPCPLGAVDLPGGLDSGKPGKPPHGELKLEIQPKVWNTNFAHSSGTVVAMIRGDGLGDVNLDSIVLIGTDAAEKPVAPLRVSRQGKQIHATFAQDEAFASLDTPTAGEVHEVKIEFTAGSETKSLGANVRIVGPPPGEDDEVDLDLAIQPDHWNVNWVHSQGTVSALIRGKGLSEVDLSSIELVGTDQNAEPLKPLRATRSGNHIRAFFASKDAFETLDTPKSGEVHELTIRLTAAGKEVELTDKIRVAGPSR